MKSFVVLCDFDVLDAASPLAKTVQDPNASSAPDQILHLESSAQQQHSHVETTHALRYTGRTLCLHYTSWYHVTIRTPWKLLAPPLPKSGSNAVRQSRLHQPLIAINNALKIFEQQLTSKGYTNNIERR